MAPGVKPAPPGEVAVLRLREVPVPLTHASEVSEPQLPENNCMYSVVMLELMLPNVIVG
jgi:hypothetical protein